MVLGWSVMPGGALQWRHLPDRSPKSEWPTDRSNEERRRRTDGTALPHEAAFQQMVAGLGQPVPRALECTECCRLSVTAIPWWPSRPSDNQRLTTIGSST